MRKEQQHQLESHKQRQEAMKSKPEPEFAKKAAMEALKKQQDLLKVVVLVLFIYHDSHNTDLQKL